MIETVSVITVVYNARSVILETIESVLGQTYPAIEYIIIDGGSSDGTVHLIDRFATRLSYFASEPDRGIYHAMNKGIARASGEWLCFMNAGDRFFAPSAIEDAIRRVARANRPDIVYGDHEVRYPGGPRRIVRSKSMVGIWKGSRFSHQSALIASAVHKAHLYDEGNPICADYEFFYRAHARGCSFLRVPVTLASVESGGISDRKRFASILGRWRVIDKSVFRAAYYAGILFLEAVKWPLRYLYGRTRHLMSRAKALVGDESSPG